MINLLVSPSFTFRDFRFLWLSSAFNSVGFIGEQVIVGWGILEITDSSFMVGVSLALRMVPFLFLGIIAGSLADRVNRRILLMLVSVGMGFLSLSLAFIIYLGFIEVWIILLLTFLAGCVRAIGQPARQSFAYDIVGTANLVNAISNLSLGMRVGGIGGSLLAGLLVGKFGADAGYLVLSVSYFASVFIILFIRSPESPDLSEQESFWQNIAENHQSLNPDLKNTDVYDIFIDQIKATMPLGKPQTPEDIGKAVAFLASSDASQITGQALNINGGGIFN